MGIYSGCPLYIVSYAGSTIYSPCINTEKGGAPNCPKKKVLSIVVLILSSILVVAKAVYDSDKLLEDSKEAE